MNRKITTHMPHGLTEGQWLDINKKTYKVCLPITKHIFTIKRVYWFEKLIRKAANGIRKFIKVLKKIFWKHHWIYRNPANRTCTICGRHEVAHCWAGDWLHDWWEIFYEGEKAKHYE